MSGPDKRAFMNNTVSTVTEHACHGGVQGFYSHYSRECDAEMRFSVYRPPQHKDGPIPVVYYLAGLTCSEETFSMKAGAQRWAAELGLMIVAPDTSPRIRLPGDDASWEFGLGASFYVDATETPWASHYRMYSYLTRELPGTIASTFGPVANSGIFGHSMGGHGALVIALRNPEQYRSVSAFAPVAAASSCPWGETALTGYLGPDRTRWRDYDAAELAARTRYDRPILIDQGRADKFLNRQLKPHLLAEACRGAGTALELRFHDEYDHSYYFIGSFIEEHLRHHARILLAVH